jgi:hypothetical protein
MFPGRVEYEWRGSRSSEGETGCLSPYRDKNKLF